MSDDAWADPLVAMQHCFTKEGLRQACFRHDLSVDGDKATLAGRLWAAGFTISRLSKGV